MRFANLISANIKEIIQQLLCSDILHY